MSTSQAEVQTLSQSRAAIYGFLAWLFLKQPDADFVTRLLANDIHDSLLIFPSGTGATSRMIDGMKVMRSSILDNGPRTLEDICLSLAVEHTRFLRGVGQAYGSPPPYESLYRSSETGEENAFLLKLTEFYRQAQAAILTEYAERVDYIGVELDLMRLLCEEEGYAHEMDDTIQAEHFSHLQQRFLREHLMVWAPRFCDSFLTQTTTDFYHGVAQLLCGFLEAEAAIGRPYRDETQVITGCIGQVLEE